MVSITPYLIKAYHAWMEDSNLSPHILIDCNNTGVIAPEQFIQDNKIVLNISYSATSSLVLETEYINFKARFSSQLVEIYIPIHAVMSIYASESGEGISFETVQTEKKVEKKPNLTLLD